MKTKDSIVELEERQCKTNVPASDKLGEECGVFGVYDFAGGDVASTIWLVCAAAQGPGELRHCSQRYRRSQGKGLKRQRYGIIE